MQKDLFRKNFDLPKDGFDELNDLSDTEIGVSVYKNREKGFKSLYKIYVSEIDKNKQTKLKPITVTVGYGKETNGGIIVASSSFERKWHWPVDLISRDDFFYDYDTNQLFYNDTVITGFEILKKVDRWHTKPGLFFYLKVLFWRKFLPFLPIIFIVFYELISGNKITKNLWSRHIEKVKSKNNEIVRETKEEESRKLNIFGYSASRYAVTLYSLIHFLLYFYLYKKDIKLVFVSNLLTSSFLTVIYVIPTLGFLDVVLPKILKYLITKSTDLAIFASFKEIKIK